MNDQKALGSSWKLTFCVFPALILTRLKAFNALIERGHTIVIIEHNLDVIKCADYMIDLGPEGGREGGQLVACGTPEEVMAQGKGYTAKYLKEALS